jgi:hypothetical protein
MELRASHGACTRLEAATRNDLEWRDVGRAAGKIGLPPGPFCPSSSEGCGARCAKRPYHVAAIIQPKLQLV